MSLDWPQTLYILLSSAGLVIALRDHGTPRTGKHNAAHSFVGVLIAWGLLWWGGFFG